MYSQYHFNERKGKSEMKIGDVIAKYRKEKNLTQMELARAVDVHFTMIGQIESGHKTPSLYLLKKINEQLQIPYDELKQFI